MMLKRKIYNKLLKWKKENHGERAVLIEGARRIGKSTVCREFAKSEYKSSIVIDFAICSDDIKDYFINTSTTLILSLCCSQLLME